MFHRRCRSKKTIAATINNGVDVDEDVDEIVGEVAVRARAALHLRKEGRTEGAVPNHPSTSEFLHSPKLRLKVAR